jgi:hypothetical protein
MSAMDDKPQFVVRSLERVATRLRESTFTQSAWRMVVESDRGAGVITMIEGVDGSFYRGEGVFLGLTQAELGATYERLNRPNDEPAFEVPQLG